MTLVTFWGTRGSIPTPGPETTKYGGNTACVTIAHEDSLLILDAGSGIKRLADFLDTHKRIDILLTHLHLDHTKIPQGMSENGRQCVPIALLVA